MGNDLNDTLQRSGRTAVRAKLDSAAPHKKTRKHPETAPAPKEIRLIKFNELKLLADEQYLIDGILPRAGLVVVWGPPKSGKSFWLYDALLHVALGWEYRSRQVEQGAVVYCYFEGQRAAAQRKEAFAQRHLREYGAEVPFVLMPVTLDLVADHQALIAAVRKAGIEPVAVALDTLNRSLRGSESKDEDMARYIAACDAIKEAFGCCVVLVHHSGHDASRYRGHSSLGGADDAMISVRPKDEASPIVVEVEHMKDGEAGAMLAFTLEVVEVGRTRKGVPITSCVVTPCDLPADSTRVRGRPEGSPKQVNALNTLDMALREVGGPPPTPMEMGRRPPPEIELPGRVVALDQWLGFAASQGVVDREAPRWRQRGDMKRLQGQLLAKKKIGVWEDFVWRVQ